MTALARLRARLRRLGAGEGDGPGEVTRLDAQGLADLAAACASPGAVARWRAKMVTVEGSDCLWWTGAVSGAGHGRFWLSARRVVVAHRFAFALAHGVREAAQVQVMGHRCDNPLCQRVGPGHMVASSYAENRREWAIRRDLTGSPLGGSARVSAACAGAARPGPARPALVAADLARLRAVYGEQLPLSLW